MHKHSIVPSLFKKTIELEGFDHNQCLLAQLANERVEPKGFSIAIEDDCWPPILESSLLRKQIEVCALSFNMTGFSDHNDGVIDILWILIWKLSVLCTNMC